MAYSETAVGRECEWERALLAIDADNTYEIAMVWDVSVNTYVESAGRTVGPDDRVEIETELRRSRGRAPLARVARANRGHRIRRANEWKLPWGSR